MILPTLQEHLAANNLTFCGELFLKANDSFYLNPSANADLDAEFEELSEFIETVSATLYAAVEDESGEEYLEDVTHTDCYFDRDWLTFINSGDCNHEELNAQNVLDNLKRTY